MHKVLETPETRKPAKAFFAHLYDQGGCLTQVNGILYFVDDDDTVQEVEPSMLNFLVVLGEMQTADAQRLHDCLRGGAAAIACSRDEGRS